MKAQRALLLLSLLPLAGGCRGPAVEARQAAIVNGQLDDGHSAVGLLHTYQGTTRIWCTGTLIGSHTVLTAAHCLYQYQSPDFTINGQTYTGAKMILHSDYDPSSLFADIGLVVLDKVVTGVAPAPLATVAPAVGQQLTIVGFGITAKGQTDIGVKRVTQNTIGAVDSQLLSYYGSTGSAGNICDGDSGGPSFRLDRGQEVQVGVHSKASVNCDVDGRDTRVDTYHAWIESSAAGDLGPGSDTTPPTVAITEPASGALLPPAFTVTVTASDGESGLARIDLLLDGAVQHSATTSPASISLDAVSDGQHELRAEATDQAGNKASAVVAITVSASAPRADLGTASSDGEGSPAGPGPSGTNGGGCAFAAAPLAGTWPVLLLGLPLLLRRRRAAVAVAREVGRH